MGENEQAVSSQSDPWEEEIDLRELIIGIAKKWYIWLGLPVIVMVITALYLSFSTQPAYVLEAEFQFDDIAFNLPEAEKLNTDSSRKRRQLTSLDNFAPVFREEFKGKIDFENKRDARRAFRNFLQGSVELTIEDLSVNVEAKTPYPGAAAGFIDSWFEKFRKMEREYILQRYDRLVAQLKGRLKNAKQRHEKWMELVAFPGEFLSEDEEKYQPFQTTSEFLPGEAQFLEIQTNLVKKITGLEERLDNLQEFPAEIEEGLGEYYSPQLPAEEQPRNRTRNTLLAGVVTGLLALFGTAFWEIL